MKRYRINLIMALLTFCLPATFFLAAGAVNAESRAPVSTQDINALWDSLRAINTFETEFVEIKTIAFLDEPIKTSGKMYYKKPGFLMKETRVPSRETLTINNGKLTLFSQVLNVRETIDLEQQPMAAKFVDYMLQVFNGDQQSLAENFSFKYSRSKIKDTIIVDLIPVESALKQIMASLQIELDQNYHPYAITWKEIDGDQTMTQFSETQYNPVNLVIPDSESR